MITAMTLGSAIRAVAVANASNIYDQPARIGESETTLESIRRPDSAVSNGANNLEDLAL